MGRWPPGNHRLLGLRFKPIFLPTYRKQLHKSDSFTQAQTQQKVWILFKRCIYFASNYIGIYSSISTIKSLYQSKKKKKKKVSFFPHFTTFRLITLLQSHSQPWRHIHMCTGSRWRFGFCRAQTVGGRRTACTENHLLVTSSLMTPQRAASVHSQWGPDLPPAGGEFTSLSLVTFSFT